jgi:ISXO2-like transposase domain/Sigma-70 region 2
VDITDADLVRLARDGDPAAFRLLVDRHMPMARARAARLCPQPDDADDAVQDAFLQAFLALDRLRDPSRFAGWLGGARVITDVWMGYHGLAGLGYVHERRCQRGARARGQDPGELLPAVHRVASLAKRWLLGTHQGSVDEAHLQSYLDEFVFRFNRRRSRSRGLVFYRVLELAVGHARWLPQHRGRQAATQDPADPASHARTSTEPGAPASGAPREGRLPGRSG